MRLKVKMMTKAIWHTKS